ncbi:MAG: NADPH-dependent F420 reductase [Actinomycetota bacterium]
MAKVAVLGTGRVGRGLAAKMASLGHDVVVGTRDPDALLARTEPGDRGTPPFNVWLGANEGVSVATFADAAASGDPIFNATAGAASLAALGAAGAQNLAGKVLIDIANPLDFSKGMPPSLFTSSDDSLAEQIQRAFPDAKVVKTLNTVTAAVMVDPGAVGGGDHDMFMAGDDAPAKTETEKILKAWFGWRSVVDLGPLSAARGMEMYLPLWVAMMMSRGNPLFNVKIVT